MTYSLQGRTSKFGGPVRNNGLGPSGLVQDHEYQAIAAGKHDVLCESTNVTSHTCDCQLNHHRRPNNCFFVPKQFFLLLEQYLLFEQQKKFLQKSLF